MSLIYIIQPSYKTFVRTSHALVRLLIANTLHPLISACRDIAAVAVFCVVKAFGVDILSVNEYGFEERNLFVG